MILTAIYSLASFEGRNPRVESLCRSLESPSDMTTATIIQRIVSNRSAYEARNAKKNKSEADYYTSKKAYINEV